MFSILVKFTFHILTNYVFHTHQICVGEGKKERRKERKKERKKEIKKERKKGREVMK